MTPELKAVYEDEAEKYDRMLIAAEKWSPLYRKNRKTYVKTIAIEARLRRQVRGVFRNFAEDIDSYINWNQYEAQRAELTASKLDAEVNVEVIVSENLYDDIDSLFFNVTLETVALAVATGAQAGEAIYDIALGIRSTDAIIQSLATDRLAWLVGKKVDKEGNVVDNPKATYRISNKTREDIARNIQTGISLGEDKEAMTKRIKTVINNPRRAEIIAQTETVNAYGSGLIEFAKESGATGKEWETVGAIDICAEYANLGTVELNYLFGGENMSPAAHTGCRCNLRIVYANEFQPKD